MAEVVDVQAFCDEICSRPRSVFLSDVLERPKRNFPLTSQS
jgi:hypothetical protein